MKNELIKSLVIALCMAQAREEKTKYVMDFVPKTRVIASINCSFCVRALIG